MASETTNHSSFSMIKVFQELWKCRHYFFLTAVTAFSLIFLYFRFLYLPVQECEIDISFDKYCIMNKTMLHYLLSGNEFSNYIENNFGKDFKYFLDTEYVRLEGEIKHNYILKIYDGSTVKCLEFFREIENLLSQKLPILYPVNMEDEKTRITEDSRNKQQQIFQLSKEYDEWHDEENKIAGRLSDLRKNLLHSYSVLGHSLADVDRIMAELIHGYCIFEFLKIYLHYTTESKEAIYEKIRILEYSLVENEKRLRSLKLFVLGKPRISSKSYFEVKLYFMTLLLLFCVYSGIVLFRRYED